MIKAASGFEMMRYGFTYLGCVCVCERGHKTNINVLISEFDYMLHGKFLGEHHSGLLET